MYLRRVYRVCTFFNNITRMEITRGRMLTVCVRRFIARDKSVYIAERITEKSGDDFISRAAGVQRSRVILLHASVIYESAASIRETLRGRAEPNSRGAPCVSLSVRGRARGTYTPMIWRGETKKKERIPRFSTIAYGCSARWVYPILRKCTPSVARAIFATNCHIRSRSRTHRRIHVDRFPFGLEERQTMEKIPRRSELHYRGLWVILYSVPILYIEPTRSPGVRLDKIAGTTAEKNNATNTQSSADLPAALLLSAPRRGTVYTTKSSQLKTTHQAFSL